MGMFSAIMQGITTFAITCAVDDQLVCITAAKIIIMQMSMTVITPAVMM